MSVEIWPRLPAEQLELVIATTRKRELEWLLEELHETLKNLKLGLEECYALLAPIDPGSTLVISTPRNEIVKGHVTRVGPRIVKGTIRIHMRTMPRQTLSINPSHPIHLAPLTSLYTLLTHSIDLLGLTMSYAYDPDPSQSPRLQDVSPHAAAIPPSSSPNFIAAQLRLLAQSLSEASALLKGPPLAETDPSWTYRSAAPSHFTPPLAPMHLPHASHLHHSSSSSALSTLTSLAGVGTHTHAAGGGGDKHGHNGSPSAADSDASPPALSFHLTIQDSCLVLWLRSLEPADAPVHFGTKLALAIGTARRLEHDEAERVFGFCCGNPGGHSGSDSGRVVGGRRHPSPELPGPLAGVAGGEGSVLGRINSAPPGSPVIGPVAAAKAGAILGRTGSPFNRLRADSGAAGAKKQGPSEKNDGLTSRDSSTAGPHEVSVFVREKVRVESADPSLLSLSAKLTALGHTLALARQNLAAVMGEKLED